MLLHQRLPRGPHGRGERLRVNLAPVRIGLLGQRDEEVRRVMLRLLAVPTISPAHLLRHLPAAAFRLAFPGIGGRGGRARTRDVLLRLLLLRVCSHAGRSRKVVDRVIEEAAPLRHRARVQDCRDRRVHPAAHDVGQLAEGLLRPPDTAARRRADLRGRVSTALRAVCFALHLRPQLSALARIHPYQLRLLLLEHAEDGRLAARA